MTAICPVHKCIFHLLAPFWSHLNTRYFDIENKRAVSERGLPAGVWK